MENPGITKPNTVEAFVKANSTLRVGADAVAVFVAQLNAISATVVKAAEANAKKELRTTIMAADIKTGFTSVTGSTSDLAYLFEQIVNLNAKDTATLGELIRQWIDAHSKT